MRLLRIWCPTIGQKARKTVTNIQHDRGGAYYVGAIPIEPATGTLDCRNKIELTTSIGNHRLLLAPAHGGLALVNAMEVAVKG